MPMAAADLAEFSTTSLGDLPGNKMAPLEFFRTSPRKSETNSSEPKRGLRLTPGSSTENKRLSARLEPLTGVHVPRTEYPKDKQSLAVRDLALSLPKPDTTRIDNPDLSATNNMEDDNLVNSYRTPRHSFSEQRERLLLDNLIQYDEDEAERFLQSQGDEELYRRWREGETSGRKLTNETKSNRQSSSKPPNPNVKSNFHPKKEAICGWETDTKKTKRDKPWGRSERRNRASAVNNSRGYASGDKNSQMDSTFKFFHYTDIALYIQQYRNTYSNHGPEQSQPSNGLYTQYFDKSCLRLDTRDFPVKLDLASSQDLVPMRHKFTTNHVIVKKDEAPPPASPPQRKPAAIPEVSPLPNCASPAALHPRFSTPKPPSPSVKLETTYRCHNTFKNSWHQAVRKTPDSQASSSSQPNSVGSGGASSSHHRQQIARNFTDRPSSQSHCSVKPHSYNKITPHFLTNELNQNNMLMPGNHQDRDTQTIRPAHFSVKGATQSLTEITAYSQARVSGRVIHSAGARPCTREVDEELDVDVPYQTSHKSFSSTRLRQITFDDNALRERCETRKQHYITLNDGKQDHASNFEEVPDKRTSPDLSERKIRLKALIAAEIRSLQQRKAMTTEQKKKLDNFRRALSNSTYHHSGSASPIPTPRLSGSIRAFYTRTADSKSVSGRKAPRYESGQRQHNSRKMDSIEDNQPIIYVTQPKLRKQSLPKPTDKQETSSGRRIIGGVTSKRGAKNGDFHQFTSITDLLSAKRRHNKAPSAVGSTKTVPQRKPKRNVGR